MKKSLEEIKDLKNKLLSLQDEYYQKVRDLKLGRGDKVLVLIFCEVESGKFEYTIKEGEIIDTNVPCYDERFSYLVKFADGETILCDNSDVAPVL